jgi:hypothetical protein
MASLQLKLDLGRRTATAPLHPANVHAVIRKSNFSVDSVPLLQRMFFFPACGFEMADEVVRAV